MHIDLEAGNWLLPKVYLDDKVFDELCEPWIYALVVKLLGKNMGYLVMKEYALALLMLTMAITGLNLIFKSTNKELHRSGGPWMLFDHYLCVFNWTPEFASPNAKIQRTMVWVRFLGLNLL